MFDPQSLTSIAAGSRLDSLSEQGLANVQRALSWLTYPIKTVDGKYGPNTRSAFGEFLADINERAGEKLTRAARDTLIDTVGAVRQQLFQDVSTPEATRKAIARVCRALSLPLKPQIAYVWATARWETAHTFEPVKEGLKRSEAWRKKHLKKYYPFYGRGYVQLTWRDNYKKYGAILDLPLVSRPNLLLDGPASLFVLVHGFATGAFTGRKLTDYVNKHARDFKNARRCINGLDKWAEIKKIAETYLKAMRGLKAM
jgi:hypothetical protein